MTAFDGEKAPLLERRDGFQGTPWDTEPTEDWSQPSYWADHYRELLAKPDPVERDLLARPQVDLWVWMLLEAGELPRSSPQTLIDAGCGITIIPHLLAFWGFHVTAIDYSPQAIEWAAALQPAPHELAIYPIPWCPCWRGLPIPPPVTLRQHSLQSWRLLPIWRSRRHNWARSI